MQSLWAEMCKACELNTTPNLSLPLSPCHIRMVCLINSSLIPLRAASRYNNGVYRATLHSSCLGSCTKCSSKLCSNKQSSSSEYLQPQACSALLFSVCPSSQDVSKYELDFHNCNLLLFSCISFASSYKEGQQASSIRPFVIPLARPA